jgi:hypothetical protein
MNDSRVHGIFPLMVLFCTVAGPLSAEGPAQEPSAAVLQRDAVFWKAYNDCDVKSMGEFFTDDVEFYHDRGGITLGLAGLVGTIRDNLCRNPEWRLRRQAVDGTVRVFPLNKDNTVYGAVLSGEHLFFILEKGKPERLDGRARFTHLWLAKDGVWKMSRILSYDHGPASR